MNICISAEDKFIELGTIALNSAVYHAAPGTNLCFYIINNGISEEKRGKVLSFFDKKNIPTFFINAKDIEKDLGMRIDAGRWTLSTFQRLYLSGFLPDDVHRLLYLDCDMLVRGPLDELYNTDLGDDCIIAGALECLSGKNKMNVGLSAQDVYINAGVLLIDIDRWRDFKVGEKSLAFLKDNIQHLQFFDQDVINAVLKDRMKVVHQKYNAYTAMFTYRYDEIMKYRNADTFCGQEMYREAIENPVIVHFTQDTISIRPWYKNGGHKYRNEWCEMRNMTPWKDLPLWEDNRPGHIKAKYMMFRWLPRKIAVSLAAMVNNRHAMQHGK